MLSKKASVLVVEDDIHLLHMMRRVLELNGYRVLITIKGEPAINMFDTESPVLVLLNIILPDMDGYTVCRRIREFSQVPIIMVSAKDSEQEKVEGLDAGADDYVSKPFSSNELMARVRAILRRSKLWDEHPEPTLHFHDLVIDFIGHQVIRAGKEINLTATEYRILSYLTRNAGQVITSNQILEKVWGKEYISETHLLHVNMARLRRKLGDDAKNFRYISTRPGIGYMMIKQT